MCLDLSLRSSAVMAELGCFYGESTVEFSRHVGTVYAIDPWPEDYIGGDDCVAAGREYQETMAEVEAIFDTMVADHPNIRKLKLRHEAAVLEFEDASLDLVYCDTIHSEAATALAMDLWAPKIKPGGWMSGHDYSDLFPGVRVAVDSRSNGSFQFWGDGNWAYRMEA